MGIVKELKKQELANDIDRYGRVLEHVETDTYVTSVQGSEIHSYVPAYMPEQTKNMAIVKELKKQELAKDINHYDRVLEHVEAGKYVMSVQGSEVHSCSPKQTKSIENYSSMELAIFSNESWLNITKSSVLKTFPRYSELLKKAECDNKIVFTYVPMDLINDLYIYLKNN